MRNKIFILSEDLNFFYLVNKELNRLKIKFKILNVGNKIPKIPNSLILTTQEEAKTLETYYKSKVNILSYNKKEKIDHYIIRVLAACRAGVNNHSELVFSIDPGSKQLGLVIFLDGYYLNSKTLYSDDDLLNDIEIYIKVLQKVNQKSLNLIFKFGSGILTLNSKLLEKIYDKFKEKKPIKFFLIDESKSSKYKIYTQDKKRIPSHEASALIIAMRKGMEVDQTNIIDLIKNFKSNDLKKKIFKFENDNNLHESLNEMAEKILIGEISINDFIDMLDDKRLKNHESFLK